jgi:hypothetical protein
VITTGLAKQPAERYPTTVDMAQAAKEAVTGSASSSAWSAPATPAGGSPSALGWRSSVHPARQHACAVPGVGSLVFIATLVIVGGVIGVVELTGDDDKGSTKPSTAVANTTEFNGTYRADDGPGTDLDGKTVSNAPATTSN